jgi:hypothetical protein
VQNYDSRDEMLAAARLHLVRTRNGSPLKLSRAISVPWNTAESLLEELEGEGLVSAPDGKTGLRNVRAEDGTLLQPRRPYRHRRSWEEILLGWLQRRQQR